MMHNKFSLPSAIVLLTLLATTDCKLVPKEGHCLHEAGDATCGENKYCDICVLTPEDGCVATRPANDCYSPCGNGYSFAQDASCLEEGSGSNDASSSGDVISSTTTVESADGTGSSSTTGSNGCVDHMDCEDPGAPLCLEGECTTCTAFGDMANDVCATASGGETPLCVDDVCVECTTEDDCNGQVCENNTCVPCTEHSQCVINACDKLDGICFPSDTQVIHVDGGGGLPISTITEGIAQVPGGDYGIIVAHQVLMLPYNESVIVENGQRILIKSNIGEHAWMSAPLNNPGVTVQGGARLYVENFDVSSGSGVGVRVISADVWLDRSIVGDNTDGGIDAVDATVTLRNSMVGGDNNNVSMIALNASTADVLYSTVGAGFGIDARTVLCSNGGSVKMRNSVLVSESDEVDLACSDTDIRNTAAEVLLPGSSNLDLGGMQIAWFQDYTLGNFRLTANRPMEIDTAAQWLDGDPTYDIDVNNRNQGPDFAGAHVAQ